MTRRERIGLILDQQAGREIMDTTETVYLGVVCQYSVACTNPATTTIMMPVLGGVDSCQDCLDLYVRLSGESA